MCGAQNTDTKEQKSTPGVKRQNPTRERDQSESQPTPRVSFAFYPTVFYRSSVGTEYCTFTLGFPFRVLPASTNPQCSVYNVINTQHTTVLNSRRTESHDIDNGCSATARNKSYYVSVPVPPVPVPVPVPGPGTVTVTVVRYPLIYDYVRARAS